MKAELAALLRMSGSLSYLNKRLTLEVSTENAAIARKIYSSLKDIYHIHVELLVRKKMRLKKNNVYIVRIPTLVKEILEDLDIVTSSFEMKRTISDKLVKKSCNNYTMDG